MVKVGAVGVCPKVWAFLNFVTRANKGLVNSPLSIYTNEKFKVEVIGVLAKPNEYKKLNLWGADGEFPLVSKFNNIIDDPGADVIIACVSGVDSIKEKIDDILNRGMTLVMVDEPIKRELSELKGKSSILIGDLIGYLEIELFSPLIHNYLSFLLGSTSVTTLKFTSRRFQKKPLEIKNDQSHVVIVPRNIPPDINYTKTIMTKRLGDKFLSLSIDAEYSYVFSLGAKIFDLALIIKVLNNEIDNSDLIRDIEIYAFPSVEMDFNQYFRSLRRIFELVKQVISSGRKV